jgi:TonB family protein
MDALLDWLARFWAGMAVHLWQTALFVGVLALVAYAMRRASARTLSLLYWAGILKLLLPLPLLGPIADGLLQSIADATIATPAAESGWTTVTVLMYPALLGPAAPGQTGLPPAAALALTAVWILGAGLVFLRRRRSGAPVNRLATHGLGDSAPAKLRRALTAADIPSRAVRVSPEGPGPFVHGRLRPVIVLPRAVVDELDRDELRAVLIHEREHLRRRDPLRYTVLAAVRAAFWHYPPAWWLARRIRETTEMACDEAVVRAGLPAKVYCRSLARTLSLGLAHGPAAALGHRASFLRRRLERIRSGRRIESMNSHRLTVAAAALAAVVVSLLPFTPATSGPGLGLDELADADLPVMLNFQQAPLAKIFQALQSTSGVEFALQGDLADKKIDIVLPRTPLKTALTRLGAVAGVTYRVLGPRDVEVHPILLSGEDGVTTPMLIPESKVNPEYPEDARKNGIMGRVILQAMVERTGAVGELEVLTVEPEAYQPFIDSAKKAISQWRYEPATLDGQPVDVYFTVKIDFKLDSGPKNL